MDFLTQITLFIVGFFTGIYASVVGGGALVLVPVFSLLGTPIVTSLATMRLGATVQEFVSAIAFWRKKAIEWDSTLWVSIWTMIGGYLGARIVLDLDKRVLSYVIAVTMVGLLFLLPHLGKTETRSTPLPRYWLPIFAVLGFLLGVYGGFYGAGFGTFVMFLFAILGGSSLLSSAGNARVIGFLMSLAASFVFLKEHVVDWNLFFPITGGMIIGSWVGVDWAVKFGSRWIKFLLILIVLASFVKLIAFPG